jgi:anhydro-N-acetylmuramic acid kinase
MILRGKGWRAILNIGGISNTTFLPPKEDQETSVISFDSGPGNMIIDEAMRILYEKEYDDNGEVGSKGKVNQEMLKELMNNSYFEKKPPKSMIFNFILGTGREL